VDELPNAFHLGYTSMGVRRLTGAGLPSASGCGPFGTVPVAVEVEAAKWDPRHAFSRQGR